jgi:predicted acylesterase/phospholipase RssA
MVRCGIGCCLNRVSVSVLLLLTVYITFGSGFVIDKRPSPSQTTLLLDSDAIYRWRRQRTIYEYKAVTSYKAMMATKRNMNLPSPVQNQIYIPKFVRNLVNLIRKPKNGNNRVTKKSKSIPKVNITTLEQLNAHWDDRYGLYRASKAKVGDTSTTDINYDTLLRAASVIGDTQIIGSKEHLNYSHPVVQLIHHRRRQYQQQRGTTTTTSTRSSDSLMKNIGSTTTATSDIKETKIGTSKSLYNDGCKVALAIEGGGMRGCISAGMVCAIHYLNLTDTIDTVYGSSAGTVVGAYLISKQLPYFGPEVYYDRLTTAGEKFIDTKRILRAIGFGLLDPRLLRDVITRRRDGGKPVLSLPFLLKTTVQETKPLDWDAFVQRQSVQPLNIVTSGLNSEKSIVFTMENNGFTSIDELTDCMHASCLLPGIAGPIMNVDKGVINGTSDSKISKKFVLGNNLDPNRYEPLADALLYEPIPYQTAITRDNVTHCIVLRTRPDGTDVTGKGGLLEKLIAKRFFQRKNNLSHQYKRMKMHLHKKIYGANIIQLNEHAYSLRDCYDTTQPHLMTIAIPPGSVEIARLEVGRKAIFDGLRRGFARAYDCLVDDPNERGRGPIVARQYFPDEILEYDPLLMDVHVSENESAFDAYIRLKGISPKSWD